MHSYLIYVILSLPFVKAATDLPPEPSFAKVENESDVIAILKEIQNTAKTGNKGGAEIAASIIASKVKKNQDLFSIAHSYIKRGAFTGIIPRCICKLVSCSLPICYSRCTSAEEENKELFDCTSCLGSMANLAAFLMAIFAMGSAVYAIDDILEELNDTKTAESRIIAQALETLQNEHEFSEKTIRSAYEICKEENEESRVSCLINALHVQKLLEDHSFHICTFQFLVSVLVECSVDCFDYYNVRCFKCIGKPIPTFIKCMKTGPPEYV